MRNDIYAAALLISGTILLCADIGSFSVLGLAFMVISIVFWLSKPIAKYFSTYYSKQDPQK